MSLVKGPFEIDYGLSTLAGIETIDVSYVVSSDDYETVQGKAYTVNGTHKVTVTLTFLESDVTSLGVVLPQYFIANGGTLSTGETVTDVNGAIDVVPGSVNSATDLIVRAAGSNAEVLRVLAAQSEIDGIDVDGKIRKVSVKLDGYSTAATVQFMRENSISNLS